MTKGKKTLIDVLHSNMGGYDPHRGVHKLHASDLMSSRRDFCPREFAICSLIDKKLRGDMISVSERHTYDVGNGIEYRVVNDYLGDTVIGNWKCRVCGKKKKWCSKPEGKKNKKHDWEYQQMRVTSPESGVSCGIDAFVDLGGKRLFAVEIKSMVKDQFQKLFAPLQDHRMRTNLYLRCIDEVGLGDQIHTGKALILYVSKAYGLKQEGRFSPFKEYEIERDDEVTEPYVEKATRLKRFQDDGVMPIGICPNSFGERPKQCAVVKECFSGVYPGKE